MVEGTLAGVAEGWVANVVNEGQGFGQVLIEVEGAGDVAGNLRDFHGVGEARAEVVGGAGGKDLGFASEAAEGAGLDDAFAVTLKRGAVGVGRCWEGSGAEGCAGIGLGDGAGIVVLGHAVLSLAEGGLK